MGKSYGTSDVNECKKVVKDVKFFGNGDTFRLISKASSENEGWMKSTKAMEIEGIGCVIQVTTQQGNNVAEALTFVPRVKIKDVAFDSDGKVIERKIVPFEIGEHY